MSPLRHIVLLALALIASGQKKVVVQYSWTISESFSIQGKDQDLFSFCGLDNTSPLPLQKLQKAHDRKIQEHFIYLETFMQYYSHVYGNLLREEGLDWVCDWNYFNSANFSSCQLPKGSRKNKLKFGLNRTDTRCQRQRPSILLPEEFNQTQESKGVLQYEWETTEIFYITMDEKNAKRFCSLQPSRLIQLEKQHQQIVDLYFDEISSIFNQVGNNLGCVGIKYPWRRRPTCTLNLLNTKKQFICPTNATETRAQVEIFTKHAQTSCSPEETHHPPTEKGEVSLSTPPPAIVPPTSPPSTGATVTPSDVEDLQTVNNDGQMQNGVSSAGPIPDVAKYRFEISYISGSPDGVTSDTILGINGAFPGPTIVASEGQYLQIEVVNRIQTGQNVTLHYHGIHQRGTPFEDGPSHITQCPIRTGGHQVYTFPLRQSGTYWYHSHLQSQYTEGLWGALIIHPKREVYRYDEEIVIVLTEWYHNSAAQNERWYLSTESRGQPPYPDSVLLNGVGRYNCSYANLKNRTCSESQQFRPVFNLAEGKTYKLRLINVGGWGTFNFTIDDHTLQAVEVDGIDVTEGVVVDAVFIGPGQRYAFILQRRPSSSNVSTSLIRAYLRTEYLFRLDNATNINPFPEALLPMGTGVIRYTSTEASSAPSETSLSRRLVAMQREIFSHEQTIPPLSQGAGINNLSFLQDGLLIPFDRRPAIDFFDMEVVLNIVFSGGGDSVRRGSFNNTPSMLPLNGRPMLARLVLGEALEPGVLNVQVPYPGVRPGGQVVQVVINNPYVGPHPIHLHGHHFWIVAEGRAGDGNYTRERHPLNLNGVRRDTAMVKERSFLVLRFIANNIGVWTLHCHIDWHNFSGMFMTFEVGRDIMRDFLYIPSEARRVCREHGVIL